jgi:hypothetical protein
MSRVSNSSSIFLQPISVRDSTCRSAGKVAGRGAGRGRGVSSSASRGATSGVGRGSISGQASGAAVQNVGEKSTRGGSSSKPPKLPVVGGKGKWQFLRNNAVFKKQWWKFFVIEGNRLLAFCFIKKRNTFFILLESGRQ